MTLLLRAPFSATLALVMSFLFAGFPSGVGEQEHPGCSTKYPAGACFDVRDFGAVGDGRTNDQGAIRLCAAAAAAAGGGVLWFGRVAGDDSPATFLTGSFEVPSHSVLHVDDGVTIFGSPSPDDYPLLPAIRTWGGSYYCAQGHSGGNFFRVNGTRHASLVRVANAVNVTVTGGGEINGNGIAWWNRCRNEGTDADRPRLVQIEDSVDVSFGGGLVMNHTPNWMLHILLTERVVVRDVVLRNPPTNSSYNTDGIDIDSSRDVHVYNVTISSGDDPIALKSGIDAAGWAAHRPTENVLIENVTILSGHALALGSEMSGGLRNITFRNIEAWNLTSGVRLKTRRGRGDHPIEAILYENVTLHDVTNPVDINMWYFCHGCADCVECHGQRDESSTPVVRNITLRNIIATGSSSAGLICGLPESPATGLRLENVRLLGVSGTPAPWRACGNLIGSAIGVEPAVPCLEKALVQQDCPSDKACNASLICRVPSDSATTPLLASWAAIGVAGALLAVSTI